MSAGLGRAWVTQGNWRSAGGLGLHLRLQLRVDACVYVFALYDVAYMASEMECHV